MRGVEICGVVTANWLVTLDSMVRMALPAARRPAANVTAEKESAYRLSRRENASSGSLLPDTAESGLGRHQSICMMDFAARFALGASLARILQLSYYGLLLRNPVAWGNSGEPSALATVIFAFLFLPKRAGRQPSSSKGKPGDGGIMVRVGLILAWAKK